MESEPAGLRPTAYSLERRPERLRQQRGTNPVRVGATRGPLVEGGVSFTRPVERGGAETKRRVAGRAGHVRGVPRSPRKLSACETMRQRRTLAEGSAQGIEVSDDAATRRDRRSVNSTPNALIIVPDDTTEFESAR